MREFISSYIIGVTTVLHAVDPREIEKLIALLTGVRENGGRIFIFGNGGSAAIASHFAGDFGKNVAPEESRRFNIISLTDNIPSLTAYANDMGYAYVFSEQLKNYRLNAQDVLIAVSSSGNSQNIIEAVTFGKSKGAQTVGLTGYTGGKLRALADFGIHVDVHEYEMIEDIHMLIFHLITLYFKRNAERQN